MQKTSWPTEFSVGNVRCFHGLQQARLRPITFLIGENSTGKTSFLGCYSVIHRMLHAEQFGFGDANFNKDPFNMGSFKDIVRNDTEKNLEDGNFVLDLVYDHEGVPSKTVRVSFVERGGQPFVNYIKFEHEGSLVEIKQPEPDAISVHLNGEVLRAKTELELILYILFFAGLPSESDDSWKNFNRFFDRWCGTSNLKERPDRVPLSFRALAPLRASPSRTYDPTKESISPEGSHVPLLLMRLARAEKDSWVKLRDQLVAFGEESGMFQDLGIDSPNKDLGSSFSVQFQVRSSFPANLVDVGYGISQSLPILVDVLRTKNTKFIVQQPEVHLHPRAQAELATFFVKSAKHSNNRFLIETHSDFLVDRVRINVKQGLINAEDVSIVFFEPNENEVAVHNLWLDEYGNLEGAPKGYRDFFFRESDRLLGFTE